MVPAELKVLGLAFYIQPSSLITAATALSARGLAKPSKMPCMLIALGEACVKVNGLVYLRRSGRETIYWGLDLYHNVGALWAIRA